MTDLARLVLDADTRGLKRGERDLKGFSANAEVTAKTVTRSFARIGTAIASAFAVSGGIGEVIRVNAQFGSSMQRVAAISGATGEELEGLRETALRLGETTQFSASEAADALGFLAMAGFSAAEANVALEDVLNLAAASGMELAQAADIASNVLSGFGMAADDAGKVSDVLAKAASSTNTNVSQLGQAMSTAAPIASALGISMETTAAAIGVMSDAGIQGERAGTALRGAFARLVNPAKDARGALAKLGLSAAEVNPEIVGFENALITLREANIGSKDAFAIFGQEVATSGLVMVQTADRVKELTAEFEDADGAAQDMAETMRNNLSGDIDQLKSAFEGLIISTGDAGATGALRSVTQAATETARIIGQNIGTIGAAAAGWAAYRVALLAGTAASAAASSAMAVQAAAAISATRQIGLLASAQIAATGAARGLTAALVANPFTAAAVAVGVLTTAMIGLGDAQRQAKAETDNLFRSLKGLAAARADDFQGARNAAQMELDALRLERTDLQDEIQDAERGITGGAGLLGGSSSRVRELEKELGGLNVQIVSASIKLSAADAAFADATKSAEQMNVPVAQATPALIQMDDALERVSETAKAANDNIEKVVTGFENLQVVNTQGGLLGGDQAQLAALMAVPDATIREGSFGVFDKNFGLFQVQEEFDSTLGSMTDTAETQTVAIARSFSDMARDITNSMQQLANGIQSGGFLDILGAAVNLFTQLGSTGLFGQSLADNINRPRIPSGDGGGYTGSGPRSGGIDGRGGFLAMLHPQETVIDHTRGQRAANDVNVTVGIDPSSGNLIAFVDGRIVQAAPSIASAGAAMAQGQSAQAAARRYR